VRTVSLYASILVLGAACSSKLGAPCQDDAQCGSGFDCFDSVCVRVCNEPSQCGPGEQCLRYHCLDAQGAVPGARQPGASANTAPEPSTSAAPTAPPLPNTTAIELRAIRRELELVHQEQVRIRELLEKRR
jgi:hypothetical protein